MPAASRPTLQRHRGGKPKLVRKRQPRWSDEAERVFLDTLAVTCNVGTAVAATGFSTTTAYYHRRTRPAFAQAWSEALQLGYERLEERMLQAAERTLTGADPDGVLPVLTVPDMLTLLTMWKRTVKDGVTRRGGRPRHEPDLAELREGIVRKLDAIERARR